MASAIVRLLPVHILKFKYILHREKELNAWERKIVKDIKAAKYYLTRKLEGYLDEIYYDLRSRGRINFENAVETWGNNEN